MRREADDRSPCRRCLRDAAPGDPLVLAPYDPFTLASPYAGEGPVFVHADGCRPFAGDRTEQVAGRTLSIRAYDADAMLADAMVLPGVRPMRFAATGGLTGWKRRRARKWRTDVLGVPALKRADDPHYDRRGPGSPESAPSTKGPTMSDEKDAVRQEEEMREHEREARERDPDERSPDSDTSPDPEGAAEPAPPGNVQTGGQSG